MSTSLFACLFVIGISINYSVHSNEAQIRNDNKICLFNFSTLAKSQAYEYQFQTKREKSGAINCGVKTFKFHKLQLIFIVILSYGKFTSYII